MRRLLPLLFVAAMLPPASAGQSGVHISEILPDPAADQREFIELWNDGAPVDLTGWTVSDLAGNTFTFPAVSLASGARVVVWGGGEGDARGPAWSMSSAWNNGGDQVYLHDAAGALVDVFAYGDAAWPDGRADPVPDAPAKGQSLALHDGAWMTASPTPGTAAATHHGTMAAQVEDVPPEAAFTSPPGTVEPGASFTVHFDISDANGDADVVSWALTGDGVLLENGTAAGAFEVPLSAPADRDLWRLRIEATDAAGRSGNDTLDVVVQAAGLVVVMPPGGVHFPTFPPGASQVLAAAPFTLRNDGETVVTPRIDVSDLTGPATIPLQGRLHIGYESETTTWTTYDGPFTVLPDVAPGQSVDVRLRLSDLPAPLAAGAYGTSFAVVA